MKAKTEMCIRDRLSGKAGDSQQTGGQNNRGNQGKDTFHHLFCLSFYVVFLLSLIHIYVSFGYDEKKPILVHMNAEFKKGGKYALKMCIRDRGNTW